jgi:L-threonylcarbamoyladenylate synthase
VDHPKAVKTALDILKAGGLVAFPTDTVYGLGALAFDGNAIESIYIAKDRPADKSIPILIGDIDDLEKVATDIPEIALKIAAHFWPGPLTLVLPKRREVPDQISATNTVGIRLPDHAFARKLLRLSGPMAVTSANLSGRTSPLTAGEVYDQLAGRIPIILDGGKTPGGVPSTVVDCLRVELNVLRVGPIKETEIRAYLGEML